jgi:hypothetical protein
MKRVSPMKSARHASHQSAQAPARAMRQAKVSHMLKRRQLTILAFAVSEVGDEVVADNRFPYVCCCLDTHYSLLLLSIVPSTSAETVAVAEGLLEKKPRCHGVVHSEEVGVGITRTNASSSASAQPPLTLSDSSITPPPQHRPIHKCRDRRSRRRLARPRLNRRNERSFVPACATSAG